ncbi:response regulator [Lysobacter sp. HX-5-24]|uniref:Response regulator n=2 Tax=Noviluteimonas gilva TaxID=2682097 RepID=A0A7C9M599_9GAMM|nr:response regulator [Lysobacter gilvus]
MRVLECGLGTAGRGGRLASGTWYQRPGTPPADLSADSHVALRPVAGGARHRASRAGSRRGDAPAARADPGPIAPQRVHGAMRNTLASNKRSLRIDESARMRTGNVSTPQMFGRRSFRRLRACLLIRAFAMSPLCDTRAPWCRSASRAVVHGDRVPRIGSHAIAGARSLATFVQPRARSMYRVIIVDDHPMVSAALKDLLETNETFEVVAVHDNGGAALSAVRTLQPDLLIIDLGVPVLGGVEVISRLRAGGSGVGILVVSGGEAHESGLRALRAGANGFVHKTDAMSEIAMAALVVARGKSYFNQELLVLAGDGQTDGRPVTRLTEREFEVFRCLVAGQSNRDIGEHMRLSNKTVSAYKMKIMRKLGARNIRDLIELARETDSA